MNTSFLGCLADDITGATDLAINLVQGGMRVVQVMEIPTAEELQQLDCDAVVVALKIRSVPAGQATAQARTVASRLSQAGCQRFLFKYCSTFDSTPEGNIGPIAEAMLDELGQRQTVFCPAFPRNGRTVYQGHLFVGQTLLNESGMENHPLNPMRDASLCRLLAAQSTLPISLISYDVIEQGWQAVSNELASTQAQFVVLDACSDTHLQVLAESIKDLRLVTGGSGIARYLPAAYRSAGHLPLAKSEPSLPNVAGRSVVLSGSCSAATRRQVANFQPQCYSRRIEPERATDADYVGELISWAREQPDDRPLMFYSTPSAGGQTADASANQPSSSVAEAIEKVHASLAEQLADQLGVRRFVVAGGETSGAVAAGLGITRLRIGPEICAGVPWTESLGDEPYALAFKSGNFGDDDFFATAINQLD